MKKILLITPDFPPSKGGIQSLLWDVASNVRCFHITVITPHRCGDARFDGKVDIRIVRTHRNRMVFLMQSLLYAFFLVPDIVVCGHVLTAPVGLFLKWLFNKPYVVYTYALEVMTSRRENIYSFFLKSAEKVISISNFTRERLLSLGIKKSRIEVIPPPVDTGRFNPNVDIESPRAKLGLGGKKVLLTVARMDSDERYKGHDCVINVLPDVLGRYPQTVYLIVGGGDDKERLRELARDRGVGESVIFLGNVPYGELPAYYCLCDVFVMPSREIHTVNGVRAEGFGIVFLEAGASGKPVIGGRSGGIPDAVVNGVTGILVDPKDPLKLRDAMVVLLGNDDLRKRMGDNARKRIEENFTTRKVVKRTEGVFSSVVSYLKTRRQKGQKR